jgi:hypothetical protein
MTVASSKPSRAGEIPGALLPTTLDPTCTAAPRSSINNRGGLFHLATHLGVRSPADAWTAATLRNSTGSAAFGHLAALLLLKNAEACFVVARSVL